MGSCDWPAIICETVLNLASCFGELNYNLRRKLSSLSKIFVFKNICWMLQKDILLFCVTAKYQQKKAILFFQMISKYH